MSDETFQYVRAVDFDGMNATTVDERFQQRLIDQSTGSKKGKILITKTPPGGGSPEGLHTHTWEQSFYILSGTMTVEIAGGMYEAPAGSLVHFPANVPHRNWNRGTEPVVHIGFNSPLPDVVPGQPVS